MDSLTKDIINKLKELRADIVGIGNLEELPDEVRNSLPIGISVAIAYPAKVIRGIEKHPNLEYLSWYEKINVQLDNTVTKGADYIQKLGYQAQAISRSYVNAAPDALLTKLPHKTVATRAGMGWIGNSALLVTKEYGSALRISSLLTDAPLIVNPPVNESLCGDCTICLTTCPGGAVIGERWSVNRPREEYYCAQKCYDKALELSRRYLGDTDVVCGKCIEICPHTRRYLDR
jgi:epoxyqueuosine reductase QueG